MVLENDIQKIENDLQKGDRQIDQDEVALDKTLESVLLEKNELKVEV